MLKTAHSIRRLFYFALSPFALCANLTPIRRAALTLALLMVGISAPVKADIIITVTGVVTSYSPNFSFSGPSLVGQPITITTDLVPSIFVPISPAACGSDVCYQNPAEDIDSTTISVSGNTVQFPDVNSSPLWL